MRKFVSVLSSVALAASMFASTAVHAAPSFSVVPFVFDPGMVCDAKAEFQNGQGLLDDNGVTNQALYLQKHCATADFAAAGADIISPLEGGPIANLTELNFDVRDDGHCGAGAPRFNVQVSGTTYFLGCTQGMHTPVVGSPGWTHVVFAAADFAVAGIPAVGTLEDIYIIFDEGTDTPVGGSIVTAGHVYLDNISVNSETFTAPAPIQTVVPLNCILKGAPFNTAIIPSNIWCKTSSPLDTYQPMSKYCKLANLFKTYSITIAGVPQSQTDFTKLCLKVK
jgi:hypothetical protein